MALITCISCGAESDFSEMPENEYLDPEDVSFFCDECRSESTNDEHGDDDDYGSFDDDDEDESD